MDEEAAPAEEKKGSPAWMATFADLMSLLMCFFVLLLAFSEMDVLKFKQLAGSMREAFGVQREIKVKDTPKGTSIIAQEFSPGRPSPTPIVVLRQNTTDETKENLDFGDLKDPDEKEEKKEDIDELKQAIREELRKVFAQQLQKLKSMLAEEVEAGLLELGSEQDEIVIRIREKGSFPSGSAQLNRSFYPILSKIGSVLKEIEGEIVVSGHTDNVPIYTSRYPSNWVLSAARSASVVHHLTKYSKVPGDRIEIRAHGESKPIDTNDTAPGRAKNRRVEISVRYGSMESIVSENLKNLLAAGYDEAVEAVEAKQEPEATTETSDATTSDAESGGSYKLIDKMFEGMQPGPAAKNLPAKTAPTTNSAAKSVPPATKSNNAKSASKNAVGQ